MQSCRGALPTSRTLSTSSVRHTRRQAYRERCERPSPTVLSISTSPASSPTASSTTPGEPISCSGSSHRLPRPPIPPPPARRRHRSTPAPRIPATLPRPRLPPPRPRERSLLRRPPRPPQPRPHPHRRGAREHHCPKAARERRYRKAARARLHLLVLPPRPPSWLLPRLPDRSGTQECDAHQLYSWTMFGPCGPDCTSLSIRSASVLHATVGRLCVNPHTNVPASCCGVALRRHGPGVHSPSRQLSSQPIMIA